MCLCRRWQEPDETLGERLWGLTEMLPERVRDVCGAATDFSITSTKLLYGFTCSASWIFFTSSMILFAPVLCEVELAQMEELQRSQQKQVCLWFHAVSSADERQWLTNVGFDFHRFYSDRAQLFQQAVRPVCHHCLDNFLRTNFVTYFVA